MTFTSLRKCLTFLHNRTLAKPPSLPEGTGLTWLNPPTTYKTAEAIARAYQDMADKSFFHLPAGPETRLTLSVMRMSGPACVRLELDIYTDAYIGGTATIYVTKTSNWTYETVVEHTLPNNLRDRALLDKSLYPHLLPIVDIVLKTNAEMGVKITPLTHNSAHEHIEAMAA